MQTLLIQEIKGKNLLFITTKNIDYIRNSQEIRLLEQEAASIRKIYSNKKSYLGRLPEIYIKLLFCNYQKYDVIFVGFLPQLIVPFFHRFGKKKLVIDFFVSVFDTLVNDRKKIAPKKLAAKFCHWLDSYVVKKADIIIADTKADASYFIQEFKGEGNKFETLYLEADMSIYYPRKQHKNIKLKDKFVVLYFGSILPLQGVEVVLDAVRLLKDQKEIYFQLIGPISSKYHKPVQNNVEYIKWISQEQLAEYIANADLCLAGHFSKDIDKARRTIPGKAYIYNAMKKVMICGDCEANKELFSTNPKIQFVEMGNPECLKEMIIKIWKQTWETKQEKHNPNKKYEIG